MKRFIIIAVSLLAAIFGVVYLTYSRGIYIDFRPNAPVEVPFRAAGKALSVFSDANTDITNIYNPIPLRGVDITAGLAGHYASDFAATEEDYLRWFGHIGDMGSNALRVTRIMDPDFYNALFDYNTARPERPLYLLQGISVGDYANNNAGDAYGSGIYDKLMTDGRAVVDVVHGRKMVISTGSLGGFYLRDVSPWVLGFLVGAEWVSDTIAYTNNNHIRPKSYQGTYFSAAENATAFEAMLAEIMDSITAYETKKYKTQRPIGFITDPAKDFLEYDEVYAKQLRKYVRLNPEHILPGDETRAGCFAAYNLFSFCDDFADYLTPEQKTELTPILQTINRSGVYGGYLELLSQYHTMPVIAAGYGLSSGRGATRADAPPMNEREQGENLLAMSRALEETHWAGGFISSWQDAWERWSWNSAYAIMGGGRYLWHDLQTDGANYGLLAFDPGEHTRTCYVDGSAGEWSEEDVVHQIGDMTVSMKYDAEGLYLLVEKPDMSPSRSLYLPLDIGPLHGAYQSESPSLTFSRPVDFIVCLRGAGRSRLLVHEYADPVRQRFLADVTGDDPYIQVPDPQSAVFSSVTMVTANNSIFHEITPETRALQRSILWDTGKLTLGNNNPASREYNSLADLCYGEGLAELRLPWAMLNFYDPPTMQVHKDYYKEYGVEGVYINKIYIGIAQNGTENIPLSPVSVKGWERDVMTHERLKESYYILQKGWRQNRMDHP